jgi:hypothetical protein
MWPLPKVHEQRLQIVLCADRITYAYFAHTHNKRIELKACSSKPLTITKSGLLWDLPQLQQQTTDFVQTHALAGAQVQVLLLRPLVHEALVYMVNNVASQDDLVAEPMAHHQYTHTLLGPYEDHYLFYVARIARALLLQIELLLLPVPVHLASVSTGFSAHLELYKYIKGSAYRSVELAYAIDHTTINFTGNLADVLAALVIGGALRQHDDLYYALGSFLGDK